MLSEEQRDRIAMKTRTERLAQSLPPKVSDPATLRRIAALLTADRGDGDGGK